MAFRHGTQYAYRCCRCRCDACRDWWNTWMRNYRQRRKARIGERMIAGKFTKDTTDA